MMGDSYRCVKAVVALCAVLAFALCGCSGGNGIEKSAHDTSADGRFAYEKGDGNGWTFSTVTDTRTGCVYLVFNDNNGKSGVGGITPLLDKFGKPTLDDRYVK